MTDDDHAELLGSYAVHLRRAGDRADAADKLLADASAHLRALCAAGRHDHMGENLGCAGCALVDRIDTHLRGAQSAESEKNRS